MSNRESVTQTCPKCKRTFRVLVDEVGLHYCPRCGPVPWDDLPDENDEQDIGDGTGLSEE